MESFFQKNRRCNKKGEMWLIPADSIKPADARYNVNKQPE